MSARDKMKQARDLIREQRYDEARVILNSLADEEMAREWLERLDAIAHTHPDYVSSPPEWVHEMVPPDEPPIPARRSRLRSLAGIVAAAVAGGLLLGIALYLSSAIIYVLVISPLLGGIGAGAVMARMVKITRVRDGTLVIVLGVTLGLAAYAGYRFGEYADFRVSAREAAAAVPGVAPEPERTVVNRALLAATGHRGWRGFITLQARDELRIITSGQNYSLLPDARPVNGATVLYWLGEMALLAIIPAWMGYRASRQPFCAETNDWLTFAPVGGVSLMNAREFLQLALAGDLYAARKHLYKDGESYALQVEVARCGMSAPTATLRVIDQRGRWQRVALVKTITAQQYRTLVLG